MNLGERIILALDVPSLSEALGWVRRFRGRVGWFKVGLELVHAAGLETLEVLQEEGVKVFYDAKFHDIPNTVAGAVRAAVRRGVGMLNLHTAGGRAMLRAAVKAKEEAQRESGVSTLLLGVTVLTSLDEEALREELRVPLAPREYALHLARLAQEAGLDGVVASPQEAEALRAACGPDFLLVTPGVRPPWAEAHDQRRTLTPGEALRAGADYLVIGRPILRAPDPEEAWERIVEDMASDPAKEGTHG